MQFGTDIAFTYGPLGWVNHSQIFTYPTYVIAVAFRVALLGVLYWWAVTRLQRGLGPWAGTFATFVLATAIVTPSLSLEPMAELSLALLGGWVVSRGLDGPVGGNDLVTSLVLGTSAGLLFLSKVSVGFFALMLVAAFAAVVLLGDGLRAAREPRRWLVALAAVGSSMITMVAAWLLLGQKLTNIDNYIGQSWEISAGFAQAMARANPDWQWHYLAVGAIAAAFLGAFVHSRRTLGVRRVLQSTAFSLFLLYAGFKMAFSAHGRGHSINFWLMAGLLGVAWAVHGKRQSRVVLLIVALVVVATLNVPIAEALLPTSGHIDALVDQATPLVSADRRAEEAAESRHWIANAFGDAQTLFPYLEGHSFHVDPYETSLAYSLGDRAEWAPPPVFQTYSSYTDLLDDENAAHFSGEDAPELVMRQVWGLAGRNAAWLSPEQMTALACNYVEVTNVADWYLLEHIGNRCGQPQTIYKTNGSVDEPVTIPSLSCPGMLTFSLEGLGGSRGETLVGLLLRPPIYWLEIAGMGTWRFVPGTGANDHLLSVPGQPDWLGSPDIPFTEGGTMIVTRTGASFTSGGSFELSFKCRQFGT